MAKRPPTPKGAKRKAGSDAFHEDLLGKDDLPTTDLSKKQPAVKESEPAPEWGGYPLTWGDEG